jgi:hypothetical protein
VYLVKQRQHYTVQITAMHGTVLQVICRVEWLRHKIFMDNYFTLPAMFICSNEKSMRVEQFTMTSVECEIMDKTSKNEKGGHRDTSQGNPKGCSLERQAGCVHSVKHAHSPWPGYQTSCCRRLQCLHGVCGQVRQNGQQLWKCLQNMEVDQETVYSPNRHDHSKRISYTQVMWWQNDAQKFPWNSCLQIDYPLATGKFGISRDRTSPTAVSRVFASQANTEHAVFLQAVWRCGHSELLLEVAYVCELESLDTKRSVDCVDLRQIISLYSADRKHLLCK